MIFKNIFTTILHFILFITRTIQNIYNKLFKKSNNNCKIINCIDTKTKKETKILEKGKYILTFKYNDKIYKRLIRGFDTPTNPKDWLPEVKHKTVTKMCPYLLVVGNDSDIDYTKDVEKFAGPNVDFYNDEKLIWEDLISKEDESLKIITSNSEIKINVNIYERVITCK